MKHEEVMLVETAEVKVVDLVTTLQKVRNQISVYENTEVAKSNLRTKGTPFQYSPNKIYSVQSNGIELTATSISVLVSIHSFLSDKSEKFEKSARLLLGEDSKLNFLWQGFSFEEWEEDIKFAINLQRIKGEISLKDLKSLEAEIVNNLSAEDKRRELALKLSNMNL